jgi:hypothetical protein
MTGQQPQAHQHHDYLAKITTFLGNFENAMWLLAMIFQIVSIGLLYLWGDLESYTGCTADWPYPLSGFARHSITSLLACKEYQLFST